MVVDSARLIVGEAVKVPVRVAGEHNGSLMCCRQSYDFDIPVHSRESVRHVRDDFTGETFLAVRVDEGKGDTGVGVGDDGEVAIIPPVRTAMECVYTIWGLPGRVIIGLNFVFLTVDGEGAVTDAIGIAAGNTLEM